MFSKSRRGQSTLEYAVLLAALCAVFVTLFSYGKNSVRAKLLMSQDRINEAAKY
jgi:hypothetical protein